MTTDAPVTPANDFAADLRALARQSRELIATLAASVRGTSLRAGYREPFQWGTSSARDLVALLVKLAAEPQPDPDTAEPQPDPDTAEQEPAA
jgi:hypothetical protein